MKIKHLAFLGLAIVGLLFVIHMAVSHGGIAGIRQGTGLGGMK